MFTAERWALAFTGVLKTGHSEDAGEALALLKTVAAPLHRIPGLFSGTSAALRLDRKIHDALEKSGAAALGAKTTETVCHFLDLLAKKGHFRHIDAVIREIEGIFDKKNGVLPVKLESAFPLDGDFEAGLLEMLKIHTGAKAIRLEKCVVPELLAGYRLQIGSESLDATLKAQLQRMTKELASGGF
jgi:F-type H+-transporting ATPase subunit delta